MAHSELEPGQSYTRPLTRPRRHRHHSGRNIFISCLATCVVIALLAVAANSSLPWVSRGAYFPDDNPSTDSQETQGGSIVVQSGQDACVILKFDNSTGRIIDSSQHCHSTVVLDAHGTPVPMGTVHRLDSISKSFLGHR